VRCRRRPGHRPCTGRMHVRAGADGGVAYRCPVCGDTGYVHNWRGSPYDLSAFRPGRRRPLVTVLVAEAEYDALAGAAAADGAVLATIAGATATEAGIVLACTGAELEDMAEAIASEVNHEPDRRRRATLDSLLARLEHAVRR